MFGLFMGFIGDDVRLLNCAFHRTCLRPTDHVSDQQTRIPLRHCPDWNMESQSLGPLGFGLLLAGIMFYHNALQIRENSEGEENAFMGDSDFRPLGGRLFR